MVRQLGHSDLQLQVTLRVTEPLKNYINVCHTTMDEPLDKILEWDQKQVKEWVFSAVKDLGERDRNGRLSSWLYHNQINGPALLLITDRDLATDEHIPIGVRKNLLLAIKHLQRRLNYATLDFLCLLESPPHGALMHQNHNHHQSLEHHQFNHSDLCATTCGGGGGGPYSSGHGGSGGDIDRISPASSTVGGGPNAPTSIKPEVFKTFVSVGELIIEFVYSIKVATALLCD